MYSLIMRTIISEFGRFLDPAHAQAQHFQKQCMTWAMRGYDEICLLVSDQS